ncbi:MAG: hypothetical protein K1000chlam1_00476 [Candidatus Anoxychlamydiales bacterium]|nr:hypothetical protein [Candidatus Anoxychlamydiales bacterium]
MKKYIFVLSDPSFKTFFKEMKKVLTNSLGKSVTIEHIGSTPVPNLGGKDILDIMIAADQKAFTKIKEKLEKEGFKFLRTASVKDRLFLKKTILFKEQKKWVHIHISKIDSKIYKDLIFFRDYLKKHPSALKEYVKIKKEALNKAKENGEVYRKHKTDFIEDILKRSKK